MDKKMAVEQNPNKEHLDRLDADANINNERVDQTGVYENGDKEHIWRRWMCTTKTTAIIRKSHFINQ